MPISKAINILESLDQSIHMHTACRMKDLARRLNISERQLFKYVKLMRRFGAPIDYNRKIHLYRYTRPGHFHIGFIPETSEE